MDALRLGRTARSDPTDLAVMAIVNRTPDSFFDQGATFADGRGPAGGRAGGRGRAPTSSTSAGSRPARATRSTRPRRSAARSPPSPPSAQRFPDVVISIDTWRAEVAAEAVAAGADLINDTWAGADPALAEVAAATGAGLVCSHAGGLRPRTRPHRAAYADVVADVVATVTGLADRAVDAGRTAGRHPRSTRRTTSARTPGTRWSSPAGSTSWSATGWPVLVALSNKDFVGETLDLPVDAAAGGHARGDGGLGLARRPGVPRAPGARDPPGARHGGRDPGRPPAGRRPPRPRLTAGGGQVQRRMRLRQAYRMPSASTATKIAISTTVTMPNPGRSKTTAQGKRNTASTANST